MYFLHRFFFRIPPSATTFANASERTSPLLQAILKTVASMQLAKNHPLKQFLVPKKVKIRGCL